MSVSVGVGTEVNLQWLLTTVMVLRACLARLEEVAVPWNNSP